MKALCFGSMNIDYVYSLDHIVGPGETIFSTGRETFAGGKGLNQSVAMAKAGLPVWHAGICGTGGELLIDTLRENGVDTSLVRVRKGQTTGTASIEVNAEGENHIIVVPAANGECDMEWLEDALHALEDCDIFLLQHEIPLDVVHEAIRRLHAMGKTVILVLHEINYAAFYSDYICAFVDGRVAKFGTVREVMNKEVLSKIYNVDFEILEIEGKPLSIYY